MKSRGYSIIVSDPECPVPSPGAILTCGYNCCLPVKVLFCVDTVGRDAGTEGWVAEVAQRLDRSRFEPHLCCLEDSERLRWLSAVCRTAVFPVTATMSAAGLRQALRLRRYMDNHGIDIIHTFMVKSALFGAAATAWKPRILITSRRNVGDRDTQSVLRRLRLSNRCATRILANSEAVRQEAIRAEKAPPWKVDVLYSGVDLSRYAPGPPDPDLAARLGLPAGAPVVGIVANFREVKGHDLFLDAARRVLTAVPGCAFLLVGSGALRSGLEARAAELGLSGRVFFHAGTRETIPQLLRLMTAACLTSMKEGFSNALLEYMACGLPVVATDAGGNREAIEDGVTGFLVKSRNPDEFAAALIAVLRDSTLRARMGCAGLERCRARFDIRDAVRRQEDYYVDLLAGAGAKRQPSPAPGQFRTRGTG